jgi:hypothetical protein
MVARLDPPVISFSSALGSVHGLNEPDTLSGHLTHVIGFAPSSLALVTASQ